MSEEYNQAISKHYAAYRPPLHQVILQANLEELPQFQLGLDVGCGTGVSTFALAKFCQQVHGVDPSTSMIEQAKPSVGIEYHVGDGEHAPLSDSSVDVVTFAGSLSYANSTALLAELQRVCQPKAHVVVYDFEVLLEKPLAQLGIEMDLVESNYDHAINFSDCEGFQAVNVYKETVELEVSAEELAHVLFSSSKRYSKLAEAFAGDDPFVNAVEALKQHNQKHVIQADTYFAMYQINI
ncbi:class I SAM-dependent methyltransferase [Vibrio sp. MMH1-50]|uniref:class I SAM-dependent methyltransferase n=1 Tax=Vibrio sp. MMH1-50 TaxID=2917764 RepID=UPI001EF247F0|nr:class I SAM-dependent methyltransferase [Vibrio sp. MMH1-50]